MVLRRFIDSALICLAALFAISERVEALDAEQVFEKAASSVVTVEPCDPTGRRIGPAAAW